MGVATFDAEQSAVPQKTFRLLNEPPIAVSALCALASQVPLPPVFCNGNIRWCMVLEPLSEVTHRLMSGYELKASYSDISQREQQAEHDEGENDRHLKRDCTTPIHSQTRKAERHASVFLLTHPKVVFQLNCFLNLECPSEDQNLHRTSNAGRWLGASLHPFGMAARFQQ